MSRPSETEQGEKHTFMRAEEVREMVLGAADTLAGLTIYGAYVEGRLDLDFVTMTGPLGLIGCHFVDDLTLRHAQIPAVDLSSTAVWDIRAEGLRTRRFEMHSGRCADMFALDHAQVDGTLTLTGTSLGSFSAYSLRVGGSFMARELYVRPEYRGGCGCWLENTDIGGDLVLDDAIVNGLDGPAIFASSAKIAAGLEISGLVRNRGGQSAVLAGTTVATTLSVLDAELDARTELPALDLTNAHATADAWLTLLRERTPFDAQQYRQLAALHEKAGQERTAREIRIAQQEDLGRRGEPGNRRWHRFLGTTLGYGYRPSRAVAGLLVTFLLSICLVWTAGAHSGLSGSCSPVNRISLAADLSIPLVKLGGTPRCELANGAAGQWATGVGWAVQIMGWTFATLSVGGITGLVRKS
ncbi:hypothetical protein ACIA8G_40810 [Lentzea sp. NPDC051213]|uniref:hypothetical protein n=1 Tax=Lentzea sp. NPDC051213 TaxID=3364126 RepID=UPI0037A59942